MREQWQIDQGNACPCKGADDMCPCQNSKKVNKAATQIRENGKMRKIMYCCEYCADFVPESCGHFDRSEIRVTPSGLWLCDSCWMDSDSPLPHWADADMPPDCSPRTQTHTDGR